MFAGQPDAGAAGADAAGEIATCGSIARAACFLDTVFQHDDYGSPDPTANVHWIIFANAGDSVILSAARKSRAHVDSAAHIVTNLGHDESELGAAASHFHTTMPYAGVLDAWIRFDDMASGDVLGDTAAYTLRLAQSGGSDSALATTGGRATLTIVADSNQRFSIIPLSRYSGVSDLSHWAVFARAYRIALVHDSNYIVCRLPCVRADTIRLRSGVELTRKF